MWSGVRSWRASEQASRTRAIEAASDLGAGVERSKAHGRTKTRAIRGVTWIRDVHAVEGRQLRDVLDAGDVCADRTAGATGHLGTLERRKAGVRVARALDDRHRPWFAIRRRDVAGHDTLVAIRGRDAAPGHAAGLARDAERGARILDAQLGARRRDLAERTASALAAIVGEIAIGVLLTLGRGRGRLVVRA